MRKIPDGEVFHLSGEFIEVDAPRRLVYTWRWESQPEFGDTRVTVEFHDRDQATEIVLRHERFPSDVARGEHEKGWSGCFERLSNFIQGGTK